MITDPQPTTRRLAITMVTAAVRGDAGTVLALLRAVDDDELATVVHTTLALARAVAGQLLTPRGLMGADLWLAETARGHPCAETRLGAALVLAHAQTVGEFDELVVIGVGAYNAVCIEADEGFDEVFTAGMLCWRSLLTIAATAAGPIMVANCAGMLWGGAAEPPKLEGTGGTLKHRTNTDPPQPMLAIPPEAEVADRRPQPRAIIPAGAPVSLRGLAILRQRERGLDL